MSSGNSMDMIAEKFEEHVMQERMLTLGWMKADAELTLRKSEDLRKVKIADIIKRALRDLCQVQIENE